METELIPSSESGWDCIFTQPWWLDAVAPGQWEAVEINQNGQVIARLPYVIQKRRGFTTLGMPPLTQTLGPALRFTSEKYATKLSQQKDLLDQLIDELPKHDYFQQNFHPSLTNWLPFSWRGFQQTTRYSYVIPDLSDLHSIWEAFVKTVRTEIRKAKKLVQVRYDLDLPAIQRMVDMTFARREIVVPYSYELIERIDNACRERDCRKIFAAEDEQGRLHAALFLVWDQHKAYYLLSGADPELRNSGATSLLLWEAIQFSAKVTQSFDFEGSMIESIERFFRSFGARQQQYFRVFRHNNLLLKMRNDLGSWRKMWRER